jgi:hypothetical protein
LLLNPDEIGRFLARIDDPTHPAHPGIVLVLIPGAQPLPVHRINYFASQKFDGFFDPHPDHPPPPTLATRIQEIAARKAEIHGSEKPPARRTRRITVRVAAMAATVALIVASGWWAAGEWSSKTPPVTSPSDAARPDFSKMLGPRPAAAAPGSNAAASEAPAQTTRAPKFDFGPPTGKRSEPARPSQTVDPRETPPPDYNPAQQRRLNQLFDSAKIERERAEGGQAPAQPAESPVLKRGLPAVLPRYRSDTEGSGKLR